eukprot:TRINITY_DN4331_c0_g1_i1.p2 TRINITY_DN4331_c0_g1~~TRINITY_DN4331_c0_g1_i1.p2  ORF type:complete len:209 (+),score=60.49 TRINITY_DN4331_c0_g1_i1:69-695(+)
MPGSADEAAIRRCFTEYLKLQKTNGTEPTEAQWARQLSVLVASAAPRDDLLSIGTTVIAFQVARRMALRRLQVFAISLGTYLFTADGALSSRPVDRACHRWLTAELSDSQTAGGDRARMLWGIERKTGSVAEVPTPPPPPPGLGSRLLLRTLREDVATAGASSRLLQEQHWFELTDGRWQHCPGLTGWFLRNWSVPLLIRVNGAVGNR